MHHHLYIAGLVFVSFVIHHVFALLRVHVFHAHAFHFLHAHAVLHGHVFIHTRHAAGLRESNTGSGKGKDQGDGFDMCHGIFLCLLLKN
ncbi:MAG: hypothetical protein ACI83P_000229 [Janthinobacterium sp.]|jgi:hypothetical protein